MAQLLNTLAAVSTVVDTGIPLAASDYYSGIDASAVDDALRAQLHDLISDKTTISYDGVWQAFKEVDKYLPGYPCNADDLTMIPDIYSGYCWSPEKNVAAPGRGECGNYKEEGSCYNREHSWPKSWFGGFDEGDGAQTDLFELWPSDGYVNNLRGNLPFGYVKAGTETYVSTNNSKIGTCESDESVGACFEMPDNLKGDLARTYFYLATAYYEEWSCCDGPGYDLWHLDAWMEADMRAWHASDAVDEQEMARNEEIFQNWQHNRNPFIDHPEWVAQITDF